MENKQKKTIWSLVLNFIIFVTEILGVVITFSGTKKYILQFQYYTLDSNIFLLVASAIMVVCNLKVLMGKNNEIPKWARMCKYMATCVVTVTFLVVIFILSPMMSVNAMDGLPEANLLESLIFMLTVKSMLWHHFICPVLAVLSFCIIEGFEKREKNRAVRGLIPTICYAIPIIILNLFRVIEGPYPFLYVYRQPWYMSIVWLIVVIGMAFLIALIIDRLATNKIDSK